MKLIVEQYNDTNVIVEEKGGEKEYYIEGVFMQANIKNRNRRIYPREVLERQLNSYNEQFVSRGRALGELGHPENPTVNLERVSHNIVRLEFANDTDIVGKAKLMDTPYGNIAKSLIKEGVQLGVSSRGLGTVRESNGVSIVQNDFFLSAIDIVADPSAPDAFVNGIMENKEWVFIDGVLTEQTIEDVQKKIDKAAKSTSRTEHEVLKILEGLLQNF